MCWICLFNLSFGLADSTHTLNASLDPNANFDTMVLEHYLDLSSRSSMWTVLDVWEEYTMTTETYVRYSILLWSILMENNSDDFWTNPKCESCNTTRTTSTQMLSGTESLTTPLQLSWGRLEKFSSLQIQMQLLVCHALCRIQIECSARMRNVTSIILHAQCLV